MDLLVVEGWSQEQWENLEPGAARDLAQLLDQDAGDEVEQLLAFCKMQDLDWGRRRGAQSQGLEELLEQGLPSWGFLLLTAVQVDRRIRLYKRLDEMGGVLYLGLERDRSGKVSRDELIEFINERLHEAGKTVDTQARETFIQRSASDLRSVSQELEKLLLYAGERPVLRSQDVESICTDHGESWVFDLTRAIAERDASAALSHLTRLMASGEHPLKLLGAMASEARRLLAARQFLDREFRGRWRRGMSYAQFQQQLSASGLAPQLTRNSYADFMCLLRAERLTMNELCRYMDGIHDADLRLKSSGNSPRLIMERLILVMCLGAKSRSGKAVGK
jgi:DNA polymerase-3 subunit delta